MRFINIKKCTNLLYNAKTIQLSQDERVMLKKGQEIMTDMLREFDNICRSNELKYWCIGGTLIGTVRLREL